MNSLRSIREPIYRNRQKAKAELCEKIKTCLTCHAGSDNYLVKIVSELNDQGINTLTGKPWTTKNLWQFLTTHWESFARIKAPGEKSEPRPEGQSVWENDVPPDLLQLVEWAMRYRKLGVVPLAIPDHVLLERVERMLELENLSFSGLVQDLLIRWLAKKERRIPEHRKIPQPPICMSLLRNSGEQVVITMSNSQRKYP